jgi:hypothetical protein
VGGKGAGGGRWGEMNQALYAHMNNKRKMKKKKIQFPVPNFSPPVTGYWVSITCVTGTSFDD